MAELISYLEAPPGDLGRLHRERLAWLEGTSGSIVALPSEYPDGYNVPRHHHSRSQLLHALRGVVLVTAQQGRWMVPPDHAMWIPAGIEHSVEMLGNVSMRSVYVTPDAIEGLPTGLRVVGMTDLMRSLIIEAVTLPAEPQPTGRTGLVLGLLLHEIPSLPEQPLGLPFPSDPKLAALCRRFVAAPSPHATIDEWAGIVGMSRRSFTRAFHRQTGLSLSTWRQQACLFAALPRLADGEPITRVALDLGYDSVPAFTTMFRRMLGTSPRGYMRGSRDNIRVSNG
ncbi:helix-turn-helix transcriptional regulator [Mesorhizobium sp.]|uniref:AraC family transcriptional regulator n=1 Tax=Mesorhizobium sp. TaxID=1871066 RepID=UPI0012298D56|nr:helix-turn-helix transcriptional regulator [Mesorhizobium sp.]TIO06972.1 MAG: AraC family transcriptional regulator [Mesorhizobium sp.]TIO35864.1 MAG: AraC family transcriptional regulator [Mesorhizobium sp.]TIP09652.1 MAG: AraC family transcriptional regulator [Mesorhizobium sp.]